MPTFIAPIRKAIVAGISAAVIGWVARRGWTIDAELADSISTAIGALVAGGLTWLVANVPHATPEG